MGPLTLSLIDFFVIPIVTIKFFLFRFVQSRVKECHRFPVTPVVSDALFGIAPEVRCKSLEESRTESSIKLLLLVVAY